MSNFLDLFRKFNPLEEAKKLEHTAEWLEARSRIVAHLVREGVLETRNDVAGFWRGDEWVSIYELLETSN